MSDEPKPESASRLATLAAESFETIFHKLTPHRQKIRDDAISAWLEGHEDDAVAISRPLLQAVADHPDTPANVRPIFEMLTKPAHQTQAILTVLGVYPIISAFVMAAVNPFVTDIANRAWHDHPSQPLSPSEAALAKLRHADTTLDLDEEARFSGYSQERFDVLEYITGEPPGVMQMLEAYRRGFITEATLRHGIRESRIRDEWADTVVKLRYAPPSPLEAIAGLVKGHLSAADAQEITVEGGLDPKHFEWLHLTAGRPPGAEGLMQLYNRKLIDEQTFTEGIEQSDIQNRWIPELLEMRRYLPPPRTIVAMLHHGAITDAKATELLEWHGVFPDDIALFLAEGHASRTETIKHLALGEVSKLYDARMITLADATLDVEALGYNTEQAGEILALVDSAKERKYREAGITRVHALMVNHRIDVNEAGTDLDKIGVEPGEKALLLKLWQLETASNVRILTLAQIQGSWRRVQMSTEDATRRLIELGYHADDVPALLALALPPTKFNQRTPKDIP